MLTGAIVSSDLRALEVLLVVNNLGDGVSWPVYFEPSSNFNDPEVFPLRTLSKNPPPEAIIVDGKLLTT
ncbi:hypothetical protein D3C73_1618710 [compost metagenome]